MRVSAGKLHRVDQVLAHAQIESKEVKQWPHHPEGFLNLVNDAKKRIKEEDFTDTKKRSTPAKR